MSAHPDPRVLLDERGGPDGPERRRLLEHVAGCGACRERLTAHDPAALFALLALSAPPPGALERLGREVERAVEHSAPRRSRTRRAWTALAASLAAALLLGSLLWRSAPAPHGPPRAALEADTARSEAPRATIEISSPPTAQLIDLSIGDTQLIMIFDERLDL